MIAVIDYGAGNLKSIANALRKLGATFTVTGDPAVVRQSERVLFPGVGHFGAMIDALTSRGLFEALKEHLDQGKPYLGICLGMQVLFAGSEEAKDKPGLGILPGTVTLFREGRPPHIGWNKVVPRGESLIEEGYAYFIHSYYVTDAPACVATTTFTTPFCSAVQHGKILAVQFHPERSGPYGLALLRRWLELGAEQEHGGEA